MKPSVSPFRRGPGFTVLELLVAMVLVGIVAGVSFSIMAATSSAWKAHKARMGAFGKARVAFEILTQRLNQATLNTYWNYDNRGAPTRYLRHSELHFTQGKASSLLPDIPDTSTDAIFFVAPLGIHEDPAFYPLTKLLSACGFYVRFSGENNRPTFLESKIPERFRYRLHQFIQPGERLGIYGSSTDEQWFRNDIEKWSFPIADNVIGLILRAKYPDGSVQRTSYNYDSRALSDPGAPPVTLHQLPPAISVTLVAIDENSAKRLADRYGPSSPPILPAANAFSDPASYESDMEEWESRLRGFNPKIDYRIITADIPIKGAKWSGN